MQKGALVLLVLLGLAGASIGGLMTWHHDRVGIDPTQFFPLKRKKNGLRPFIGDPEPAKRRIIVEAGRAIEIVSTGFFQVQGSCGWSCGHHQEKHQTRAHVILIILFLS